MGSDFKTLTRVEIGFNGFQKIAAGKPNSGKDKKQAEMSSFPACLQAERPLRGYGLLDGLFPTPSTTSTACSRRGLPPTSL